MQIILNEPSQAHKALQKVWLDVKNKLLAGKRQVLELRDYDDCVTNLQRRYYHGFVLLEISKQALVDGKKYNLDTWKEYMRKIYLGDKIVTTINPMTGAETKEVVRVSSESLTITGYNALIEQVTAFAVTDLGVNFNQDFDAWIAEQVGAL